MTIAAEQDGSRRAWPPSCAPTRVSWATGRSCTGAAPPAPRAWRGDGRPHGGHGRGRPGTCAATGSRARPTAARWPAALPPGIAARVHEAVLALIRAPDPAECVRPSFPALLGVDAASLCCEALRPHWRSLPPGAVAAADARAARAVPRPAFGRAAAACRSGAAGRARRAGAAAADAARRSARAGQPRCRNADRPAGRGTLSGSSASRAGGADRPLSAAHLSASEAAGRVPRVARVGEARIAADRRGLWAGPSFFRGVPDRASRRGTVACGTRDHCVKPICARGLRPRRGRGLGNRDAGAPPLRRAQLLPLSGAQARRSEQRRRNCLAHRKRCRPFRKLWRGHRRHR